MRSLRHLVTPCFVATVTLASTVIAQEATDEKTGTAAEVERVEVGTQQTTPVDDLEQLVEWMSGAFSSAVQAADNPAFLDIRLHMVPIWTGRADGRWLYVEQAVASSQESPYRQRVYRVTEPTKGLFQSEVFTIPDPQRFAGAWRSDTPLAELGPDDLVLRSGCEILMRRRGDRFLGSTLDTLCPSELYGADHATSEVEISRWGLISWDRGWSADGEQVWGATEGGYIFDRVDSADAESTASDQEQGAAGSPHAAPGDEAAEPVPDVEPPAEG